MDEHGGKAEIVAWGKENESGIKDLIKQQYSRILSRGNWKETNKPFKVIEQS